MYGFWAAVWKFATSLQKQSCCEYQAYIGIFINKVNSTHVITSCMPWDSLSVQSVDIFLSSEILERRTVRFEKFKNIRNGTGGSFYVEVIQLTSLSVNIRVRRKDLNTQFRETLLYSPQTIQALLDISVLFAAYTQTLL